MIKGKTQNHVLIINLWGGHPSAFVDATLQHLATTTYLRTLGADMCSRAYTTNSSPACAGHDFMVPSSNSVANMIDDIWHPWSEGTKSSIFHEARQAGYKTWLFGAFGLDAAQEERTANGVDLDSNSLSSFGVDVFNTLDGAFSNEESYDAQTLDSATHLIASWKCNERHFCIINLLACEKIKSYSFKNIEERADKALTPTTNASAWMSTVEDKGGDANKRANKVPASSLAGRVVLDKHPNGRKQKEKSTKNQEGAPHSSTPEAQHRTTLFQNLCRGETGAPPSFTQVVDGVNAMDTAAWEILKGLDSRMHTLLQVCMRVSDGAASTLLTSTHSISMYEHACMTELPWEACTRSFFVMCTPQTRAIAVNEQANEKWNLQHGPTSLRVIIGWLRAQLRSSLGNISPSNTDHDACITTCLRPSLLCAAQISPQEEAFDMSIFWARVVVPLRSRVYALVFWWSVNDMAELNTSSASEVNSSARNTSMLLKHRLSHLHSIRQHGGIRDKQRSARIWTALPISAHTLRSAFDLTQDSLEEENLLSSSRAWTQTMCCESLIHLAQKAVRADLPSVHFNIPPYLTVTRPTSLRHSHSIHPTTKDEEGEESKEKVEFNPSEQFKSVYVQTSETTEIHPLQPRIPPPLPTVTTPQKESLQSGIVMSPLHTSKETNASATLSSITAPFPSSNTAHVPSSNTAHAPSSNRSAVSLSVSTTIGVGRATEIKGAVSKLEMRYIGKRR